MRISIGNKKLTTKPNTQKETGIYFKDLKFKTGDFDPKDFSEIIGSGYTITYLFKDEVFDRSGSYMKSNYIGTQFICVDVDRCEIPPLDFISGIKYKPSIIHTTFSNLTAKKDNKYCFHLIYFFDKIIYGEDNFQQVFDILTEDYKKHVDGNAKDCHRVMFTSNSNLSNYEYYNYDVCYRLDDFVSNKFDRITNFFIADEACSTHQNNMLQYSSTSDENMSVKNEISQPKSKLDKPRNNTFNLDENFLKDMFSMSRKNFIERYSIVYPYITQTQIDESRFTNGYVDLRNEDYYVVPSSKFRRDKTTNKPVIPKIKEGFRTKILWLDIMTFMKIVPDISKEYLVYLATTEVYRNFENNDGQMTNYFIIEKCREVWNNIDKLNVKPMKKLFKIDVPYWLSKGYNDWLEVAKIIMTQMKYDEFGCLYDFSATLEDNLKAFRKFGVNTTKKTLKKWLTNNNLPYETTKGLRDKMVIKLYLEDTKRSSHDIERLCRDNGVEVSAPTVRTILKDQNLL